mmetsp:Transcript_97694/g.232574  ORF Transcript_97694/g.232574 Transcript_97694/m.232574 type:complete len:201 (-) Transcript_97694:67-669(-)
MSHLPAVHQSRRWQSHRGRGDRPLRDVPPSGEAGGGRAVRGLPPGQPLLLQLRVQPLSPGAAHPAPHVAVPGLAHRVWDQHLGLPPAVWGLHSLAHPRGGRGPGAGHGVPGGLGAQGALDAGGAEPSASPPPAGGRLQHLLMRGALILGAKLRLRVFSLFSPNPQCSGRTRRSAETQTDGDNVIPKAAVRPFPASLDSWN